MAKIGLCMIVKNEAHVIRRCLNSVRSLIDYVLIVDTGSTDGTQAKVHQWLADRYIPGEVVEEPWQDFAYNRSFAMNKLRERRDIDYALMLDADNYLVFEPQFDPVLFKRGLASDLYDIEIRTGVGVHHCPLLFSNRRSFRYRGVLHEYLEGEGTRSRAEGFFSAQIQDSARNRNPDKYRDDAAVLEKALESETDPFLVTRYTFYLAQSYRDGNEPEKALVTYLRRTELGGWVEELFISFYQAGLLRERLGHDESLILSAYLAGYEACPTRSESLHAAARFCRVIGRNQQSYLFAKHALTIPFPDRPLFGESWIYQYGALDELSIAAYWTGRYRESLEACQKLLKNPQLPSQEKSRIFENANHAIKALGQPNLRNLLPAQ